MLLHTSHTALLAVTVTVRVQLFQVQLMITRCSAARHADLEVTLSAYLARRFVPQRRPGLHTHAYDVEQAPSLPLTSSPFFAPSKSECLSSFFLSRFEQLCKQWHWPAMSTDERTPLLRRLESPLANANPHRSFRFWVTLFCFFVLGIAGGVYLYGIPNACPALARDLNSTKVRTPSLLARQS